MGLSFASRQTDEFKSNIYFINGYIIRGYCVRVIFVVNIVAKIVFRYGKYVTLFHSQGRGWGKFLGGWVGLSLY